MKSTLMFVSLIALAGCSKADGPTPGPAPGTPTDKASTENPQVAQAKKVFAKVGGALSERLGAAMQEGGVVKAIDVCKTEAAKLTASAIEGTGIKAGRTSHKLRSRANEPADWMKPIVADGAGKTADEMSVRTVDLGDRTGVMVPIRANGMCLSCHGNDGAIGKETRAALAAAYPEDQARGFLDGDLRGWFWAEVPKDLK